MKLTDLKQMVNSRQSVIGFLHITDQYALNELFNKWYDVRHKSFADIANKAFELYSDGRITNKTCSSIITLICDENSRFRTESHRFENHTIYEYSEDAQAYVFHSHGTLRDFKRLNHYID